ncbi:efflux RND transporter periplasmic adaptor subunit [Planctomicrobium sp. SH664]|uniref:efflux RND transporter periplasmic adaptor subunit n=1 Tax=Planctomicrobium sp. SH664 TaxID=3448125 RepID=UPI003F5AF7F3
MTSFVEKVTFSTDRTGVLLTVREEGETVKPQEIVIRLKDEVPVAQLAVATAKAESDADIHAAVKAAEAARVEAEAARDANRKSPANSPAFPLIQVQKLQLNAEAADLKIEQAKTEKRVNELMRDQAAAELATFRIHSGIGGMVTHAYKRPGEGVQQGEPVLQVVNTDRLRVEGYVNDVDVFQLKVGQPVTVTLDVPDSATELKQKKFGGKLGFIDVSIQPLGKVIRVWAEIDNSEGLLREGLKGTMTIDTAAKEDRSALTAPALTR